MAKMENVLWVCKTFIYIWGLSGYWFSLIYLFIFFRWKIKNKHKMRYDFKLIRKWFILLGCTFMPLGITIRSFGSTQPFIYQQLIACLEAPVISLCVFLTIYILYKKGFAKKYELFLPLLFWSLVVPLAIYKKVQTDSAMGKDPGLPKGTAGAGGQARLP